jgi:predicted PurR-regulated permease PerM
MSDGRYSGSGQVDASRRMTPAHSAHPTEGRSAAITVLAVLAVVAALYFGRELLVPIALAILFTGLLRPVVRRLERWRVPPPVGATLLLVAVLGLGAGAALTLAHPVRQWVSQAPQTLAAARHRLQDLRRPFDRLSAAARQVAGAPSDSASNRAAGTSAPESKSPNMSAVAVRAFGTTTGLISMVVEVVLLTLLLLASGDTFLTKLVKVLPLRQEKIEAVRVAHEAEGVVSHYMLVTALINVGQGLLVGLALWIAHFPNPALWGTLTFVLEFVPYLGGALMLILLTLAGLAGGGGVGRVLLAPGIYLTITTLQNNLVSPVAYGRRLRLNPVAVLVGVLFWWYLWGVPGAFLAVPIIATLKILGDHVPRLAPVGEFLGE